MLLGRDLMVGALGPLGERRRKHETEGLNMLVLVW